MFSELTLAQVPEFGSYCSTAAVRWTPVILSPPTANAFPLGSRFAVWRYLPVTIPPVDDHVPLTGSYNSVAESAPPVPMPPQTSTLPLGQLSCSVKFTTGNQRTACRP